jgi:hypothetical protein
VTMTAVLLAAEETPVFLGEDLLAWLVLAIGAAMAVGSVMAIVRPPDRPKEGDLAQAPVTRSVVMAVVGALAAVWALASLVS